MKIFEISFGRTGTTSLSKAMRMLGYRVLHAWGTEYDQLCLEELLDGRLHFRIDQADFVSDIAAPFYQELDENYPGSKFILLVRDEQEWLKSWINHARSSKFQPAMNYQTFYRILKLGCYWPEKNPERVLRANREHQRAVKHYFQDRREDLLILDICGGASWEPLCEFLGKPVPAIAFPHANRGRSLPDAADDPKNPQPVAVGISSEVSQKNFKQPQPARSIDKPRILFASYHCYLDPSSGAALSTRDMLEMLTARDWPVRVFCGPLLDHGPAERVEQIVSDLRIPFETKGLEIGENAAAMLHCAVAGVDVSVYCAADRKRLAPQDADVFSRFTSGS